MARVTSVRWALAFACTLTVTMRVAGQQAPTDATRIRLWLPACAGGSAPVLHAALALELAPLGALLVSEDPELQLEMDFRCAETGAVELVAMRLRDHDGVEAIARRALDTPVRDLREAALIATEFVRSVLRPEPHAPVPPAPLTPPSATDAAPLDAMCRAVPPRATTCESPEHLAEPRREPPPTLPASPIFLDITASGVTHPAGSYAALGLEVDVGLQLAALARVRLGAFGNVAWRGADEGEAYATTLGASSVVAWAGGAQSLFLEVGPRVDVAWTHVFGTPAAGFVAHVLDAAYVSVGLDARARVSLGDVWILAGLNLGLGVVGADARVGDRRLVSQDGVRLGGDLGLAWTL